MDFRSQLSAFQKGGGRGNNSNHNRNNNHRSQSPNRSRHHHDNRSYSHSPYGRNNDRRRPAPNDFHHNSPYGPPPHQRRRYNRDPDGLGDLRGFGYKIGRGFPEAPSDMQKPPKHIALLAITIDDMPYEHLWRGWCDTLNSIQSDQDDYYVSLICHAKYPHKVQSDWLKQRLMTYPPKRGRGNSFEDPKFLSHTPSWGSVEITRAMLDLMEDGLKIGNAANPTDDKRFSANRFVIRTPASFEEDKTLIPPVDHFLFVSETCIPVATAPEFFAKIANRPVSWVNARHRSQEGTPKNKYEDDQFAGINRRIPGQYRWKADQWMLISHRHAKDIIGMDRPHMSIKHQLWQSFRDINASDEMFFPTALALLGYLRFTEDGNDTQLSRSMTASSEANPPANNTANQTPAPDGSEKPAAAVTPAKKDTNTDVDTDTKHAPPANKNECILLRPVTYTDWSEGMRNPATFANGVSDLKRIGKIAREEGCLVARKFATHIPIPGVSKEDQKITGEISLAEWNTTMLALHELEANAKEVLPYASESVQEVEDGVDKEEEAPEGPKVADSNPLADK